MELVTGRPHTSLFHFSLLPLLGRPTDSLPTAADITSPIVPNQHVVSISFGSAAANDGCGSGVVELGKDG